MNCDMTFNEIFWNERRLDGNLEKCVIWVITRIPLDITIKVR